MCKNWPILLHFIRSVNEPLLRTQNKERFIFRDFQDFYGQKQELEASNRSEVPRQNDDPVNPDQSFGHGKDSSSAAALERLASSRADE